MNPTPKIVPVLAVLAACAGGATCAGQASPPRQSTDLERAYVYEVAPEQVAEAQEAGFIEVTGTSSVKVPADRAQATFAVETRSARAGDAAAANADAMDAVLRALRDADFPGLQIETFGYSLRPEYSYPTQDRRVRVIDGYTAVNNIRVVIEDVEGAGRLIDLAIGAGANRVASLTFAAADTDDARAEALTGAVERARREAAAIAAALGRELGPPLEVRVGARPLAGQARMRLEFAAAADTPIEPGDQTVSATVTIRFALGPERSGR